MHHYHINKSTKFGHRRALIKGTIVIWRSRCTIRNSVHIGWNCTYGTDNSWFPSVIYTKTYKSLANIPLYNVQKNENELHLHFWLKSCCHIAFWPTVYLLQRYYILFITLANSRAHARIILLFYFHTLCLIEKLFMFWWGYVDFNRWFFTQVMRIYVNVHTEYGQNIKHRAWKSV